MYAAGGGFGFMATALISAGFEFGAELSYPVPEERSAGVLNVAAQAAGVLFISVLQASRCACCWPLPCPRWSPAAHAVRTEPGSGVVDGLCVL